MSRVRNYTVLALAAVGLAISPARANASTLTIADGPDTWRLTTPTSCTANTQCDITLSVTYTAASPRLGTWLQAVQWDLTDPNITPTTIGFQTATAGGWTFSFNNVNNQGGNGGCNGGDSNAVCGVETNASSGGGMLVSAGTFTWTFHSLFASNIASFNTGNIRAGYSVDPDGNGGLNTIFSPNGGTFGGGGSGGGGAGGGGAGGGNIPEPASLLLFGAAAVGAVNRIRNRLAR